jgi:NAD(P)-dependent dehydrogenase (short-subunit alcohol dehydrogenase family)/rhamnose utilization protein RhaD (predicted bifunctional aldolase and dehydrogenase)
MENQINDLIAISQLYGRKPEYVIAGGGNTSWKNDQLLYIKASGVSLSDIDANGFCVLDREKLALLPGMQFSSDPVVREEQVKNGLLNSRIHPESGLRPSVETSLHDLFSYQFVVHTHPTLVNGLLCSIEAEKRTAEFFGNSALYIPYSDPGFMLFTLIRRRILGYRQQYGFDPHLVFIQNHGVFVAADHIREIRELYAGIESVLLAHISRIPENEPVGVSLLLSSIVPGVRMLLSVDTMKVARAFNNRPVVPFITGAMAFRRIARPFTPDQMVYCLSEYLFVENTTSADSLIEEIRSGIAAFKARKGVNPKVIFIKNEGVIVVEDSPVALDYLENLVLDFTRIALLSENFGGPHPMTGEQIAFIENWEVENYRKKVSLGGKPKGKVENKIVVVTGAAQGFGAGIAEILFSEGANIVIADLNEEKGKEFAGQLNAPGKKNKAFFVKVNVADANSVEEMVRKTVNHFGGLDVLISNAGILRAGSLDEMTPETFDLMTRVNYNAYFHCAKYASAVMKTQYKYHPGTYMDIIQINSKSGLKGSNKNFAYAGGKFGGIGLTQSFALELMPFHIKVNSICPGNYFDGPLWADPENGLFVQYLKAGKIKGAKTVADVKRHYESKVPAGRGCLPSDVAKAIFYIIGQEYETGQAVPVTGGQEMLS